MDPAKDFDAIADDYVFFETHATEAAEDARAYAARLNGIPAQGKSVRMLDFGCGTGSFTSRLINQLGWQRGSVQLSLVEPADEARRAAVDRLGEFASGPIQESAKLRADTARLFDVVLSNHVFYYVPDLPSILGQLVHALAPGGVFVTGIASRANALIQLWLAAFRAIDRPLPYHTSEDVESTLKTLDVQFEKEEVPYQLVFVDNRENRLRLMRFLLAEHLAVMPQEKLLAFFDYYSYAGRIEIHTASDHYTVRNQSASS